MVQDSAIDRPSCRFQMAPKVKKQFNDLSHYFGSPPPGAAKTPKAAIKAAATKAKASVKAKAAATKAASKAAETKPTTARDPAKDTADLRRDLPPDLRARFDEEKALIEKGGGSVSCCGPLGERRR